MACRWSCMSKMKKTRKPGGGRKKLKPEYDAGKNLKEQLDAAVALYNSKMFLQAIGEELGLNPIKVRKLLITAGVYESEVAEKVKNTFEEYRETQDYKTSILSTANTLQMLADGQMLGTVLFTQTAFDALRCLPVEHSQIAVIDAGGHGIVAFLVIIHSEGY